MKNSPWLILLAVYMVSISIVMTMFKVPPVMPILMGELQIDLVAAGLLMSVFSFTSVILAFPAAFVLKKLGPRTSGLISIGSAVIGSLIGFMAPNFQILMLSRVIEGIGLGFMSVIAPAVIAMTFPPEKRGLPIGIWASWFPCGMFFIFAVAPTLATEFGHQSLWLFTAAFAIIAMIIYAIFVPGLEGNENEEQTKDEQPHLVAGLKFPGIWILAFGMFAFNLAVQGYANWAPTYFITILQVAPVQAGFYMSLMMIISVIGSVFAGWITDRIRNPRLLLTSVFAVLAIIWIFAFTLNTRQIAGYMVLNGLVSPFVPTVIFTMIPKTLPNMTYAGVAMACVNFLQNIGVLISPPIMGLIILKSSWPSAASLMVVAAVLGAVAMLFYRSAAGDNSARNILSC